MSQFSLSVAIGYLRALSARWLFSVADHLIFLRLIYRSKIRTFIDLYHGSWHRLPTVADLRALPINHWHFFFPVTPSRSTSPPYHSTLLLESFHDRNFPVVVWLLLNQRLIVHHTNGLTGRSLLLDLQFLDSSGNSLFLLSSRPAFCTSFRQASSLSGLALLPFGDLVAVMNCFLVHSTKCKSVKGLFLLLVAFQRHLVFSDLDETRQLLALGATRVSYCQLQSLLARFRLRSHQGLNPGVLFAPVAEILARVQFGRALHQLLPSAFEPLPPPTNCPFRL